MDQDDRPDANTDTSEENSTLQPPETDASILGVPLNTMTHAKPEVKVQNHQTDIEPAGINTIEMTTVSPEIEPSTVAFKPEGDLKEVTERNSAATSGQSTSEHSQQSQAPAATLKVNERDKKWLIITIAAIATLFAVLGALTWWMIGSNKDTSQDQSSSTLSTPIEQPKLGVALTVTDGTVEYSVNEAEWQTATTDTGLKEGNFIRTSTESRAVLTLDDGSAVRLDASTQVELADLTANNVEIKLVEGSVYSRVVPSERAYIVTVDDSTYEAMGTAFVTVKTESENGVQVYQSSVKTSDSEEAVTEGKQYYKTSSNTALQGKLTDINIDTLVENAFLNWNLSQDENDTNFRDKLGILSQVKERSAALEAERQATQAAKEEAARILREKQEAEQASQKTKVTRGVMTLGLVGKKLSWTYTGKAIHGYKLVYSKKTATPTFGTHDAIYFSDINETTGELPSKDKIGSGTYYIRACAYTANTEDEGCVDYSNMVVVVI